jgi:hypothetical protein
MTEATTMTVAAGADATQPQRLQLHLDLATVGFGLLVEEVDHDRVYDGVAIRAGIYIPGVGNSTGLRIRIRPEVLRAIAPSWKGKKVDMEHQQDIENEVGFIQDSWYDANVQGVRQQLRLQAARPKFLDAVGFVVGRTKAGQVPELSVEFEDTVFRSADAREKAFFDLDLVGATGAGVALVSRGACGAKDGCGIGLSYHTEAAKANPPPSNAAGGVSSHGDHPTMPCEAGCAQKFAKMEIDLQTAMKERDELRVKVGAHEATLKQKDVELTAANTVIQGFREAERQALLEGLKAVAPATADLKVILGAEPKDASLDSIKTALAAFKAMGSKPAPMDGAGRRSIQTKRDEGAPDKASFLEAQRQKLGLAAADGKSASKLPLSMQRNTKALLGVPAGKGGAA